MPGLLRGVARTAVVAGTATAVSGRVQRRQAERYVERDAHIYAEREQAYQQEAPAPASSSIDDMIAQLKQLGELKQQGVLTEDEFVAQKARILGD